MSPARRLWIRIVRFCARAVLFFLLIGVPGALVFLQIQGLPRHWTEPLLASLSGDQYRVSIDRLTFGVLSGFTARGARLENRDGVVVMRCDRVTLSPNLAALWQGKFVVDELEIGNADLQIPLAPGRVLDLRSVQARVRVIPGQLRISRCRFFWQGIETRITGTLLNPSGMKLPESRGGDAPAWLDTFGRVEDELTKVEWQGIPLVELEVAGSLDRIEGIEVSPLRVSTGGVEWRGAGWEELQMEAAWKAGEFTLSELSIRDEAGRAVLHGSFQTVKKSGRVRGACSLDLWPWVRALEYDKALEEVRAPSKSLIEGSLEFSQQADGKWDCFLLGGLKIEDAAFRGVGVDLVQAEFSWKPGKFLTRNARVKAAPVEATIDFLLEDGQAKVRAEGLADPTRCLPWLDEGMKRVFQEMEFSAPGAGRIEMEWPVRESAKLHGKGSVELGAAAMRGAWIDSAVSEVEIADRAVIYRNLEVRRGNGLGTGTFVYDFGRQEVRLENIVSTLDPFQILLWVDPRIAETVKVYRFRHAPTVHADGVVHMKAPEKTRLDLRLNTGGLDYDLLGETLNFGSTQGTISVRGRRLQAKIPTAGLFGGNIALEADVSLDEANPTYSLKARAERLEFAPLTSLYFGYTDSTGWMSGEISYRARFDDQTRLEGDGSIRVDRGNVFAIPLLGPFSVILSSILPGVGYQNARTATADFTVANQTISTNNLEIVGQGFGLYGEGDIYFVADRLDMTVRINAQGVPGLLLFPVSKLFEYVSYGSVSDPVWRPKNLPREMLGISDEQAMIPGRESSASSASPSGAGKFRRRK